MTNREHIARIIDPAPFGEFPANDAGDVEGRGRYRRRRAYALRRADAILALLGLEKPKDHAA